MATTRRKASTTPKRATTAKKLSKSSAQTDQTVPVPIDYAIASRASELFVARGGEHGRDWNDWLSAERELLSAQR